MLPKIYKNKKAAVLKPIIIFLVMILMLGNVFFLKAPKAQAFSIPIEYGACNQPIYEEQPNYLGVPLLATQTLTKAGSPYCIRRAILPGWNKLVMEPGTVIKFLEPWQGTWYMQGATLGFDGPVEIKGEASAPVVFTSIYDDSYAGDTNGDGDLTAPYAGLWETVSFNGESLKTVNYAIFKYGGLGMGVPALHTGLSENVYITNSVFKDNLKALSFGSTVKEFKNNKIYALPGERMLDAPLFSNEPQDVSYNYWGDASGPSVCSVSYHGQYSYDNMPRGTQVCGNLDYEPWLTSDVDPTPIWRANILPGDILYDPYTSGVGHTGIYVGNGKVIEAVGDTSHPNDPKISHVVENDIISWDYPNRKNVYLLRVLKPEAISDSEWEQKKQMAVDFAISQQMQNKPYNWKWINKSAEASNPSWYCSELVWASYYNQGIDLDFHNDGGLINPVSPVEIFIDDNVVPVANHLEDSADGLRSFIFLEIHSPVLVTLTDPDGQDMDKNSTGNFGGLYLENDSGENGELRDVFVLPTKVGNYHVAVVPKEGAGDEETYTLVVKIGDWEIELAKNIKVKDIPQGGYDFFVDENGALLKTNQIGHHSFFDEEKAEENFYKTGTLDLEATSSSAENLLYNGSVEGHLILSNVGDLDFKMASSFLATSTSQILCDHLLVRAEDNGHNILYDGLANNFYLATSTLASSTSVDISLNFSLDSDREDLKNQTCLLNVESKAWQAELVDDSWGFSDREISQITVTTGSWSSEPPSEEPPALTPTVATDIVINEFLPNPLGTDSALMPNGEWVELYNKGETDFDINGWYLYDSDDNHDLAITNMNTNLATTIIPSHGWLVVYRNGDSGFALNNDIDIVRLFTKEISQGGILIDSYSYDGRDHNQLTPTLGESNVDDSAGGSADSIPENKSFARIPDGSGAFVDPWPTPGESNQLFNEEIFAEEGVVVETNNEGETKENETISNEILEIDKEENNEEEIVAENKILIDEELLTDSQEQGSD